MKKIKNIKTGKVFDVTKITGEYWIDETGYIESDQLGVTWELIDDYKQLYEQEKQRADRSERQWSDLKKILIALNESKSIKGAAKASAIINLNTMLNIEMKYREDTE